jgi:hypothetical protein
MKTTHKKRNIVFLTAVPAIALVLGFMWAGCSNPAGGGPPAAVPVTYIGGGGSSVTELIIDDKDATETTYELKVGGVTVSTGKVTIANGSYNFVSDAGKTFTAAISGGAPDFTGVSIEADDGSTLPPLPVLTVVDTDHPFYQADQFAVTYSAGAALTFTKFNDWGASDTVNVYATLASAGLSDVALAANGTITLNLGTPNATAWALSPPVVYDWDAAGASSQVDITVSATGAKSFAIDCFHTSDEAKRLMLIHKNDTPSNDNLGNNYIEYMYATEAVIIMGTSPGQGEQGLDRYNLNLKQGWNMVVVRKAPGGNTTTTENFNRDDYHWVVWNWGNQTID